MSRETGRIFSGQQRVVGILKPEWPITNWNCVSSGKSLDPKTRGTFCRELSRDTCLFHLMHPDARFWSRFTITVTRTWT